MRALRAKPLWRRRWWPAPPTRPLLRSEESRSGASVTSAQPPKRLGSSAIEHVSGPNNYEIVWQRGTIVEAVALNINVPASAGSSTSTTIAALPITSAQQEVLSSAAVKQDAQLK